MSKPEIKNKAKSAFHCAHEGGKNKSNTPAEQRPWIKAAKSGGLAIASVGLGCASYGIFQAGQNIPAHDIAQSLFYGWGIFMTGAGSVAAACKALAPLVETEDTTETKPKTTDKKGFQP